MSKYVDLKEFQEKGYLQELNRRFLHPLGMAMQVSKDNETGEVSFLGFIDSRDDDEGFIFDFEKVSDDRLALMKAKRDNVQGELDSKYDKRSDLFGFESFLDAVEYLPR